MYKYIQYIYIYVCVCVIVFNYVYIYIMQLYILICAILLMLIWSYLVICCYYILLSFTSPTISQRTIRLIPSPNIYSRKKHRNHGLGDLPISQTAIKNDHRNYWFFYHGFHMKNCDFPQQTVYKLTKLWQNHNFNG